MIVFRVIQGAGAAIMFPAALAIVLGAFPVSERGKAMAIFFAIAGGLTAIGPLAGGYLVEIDLAGDLLGQHPGRDHRPRPDLEIEAGQREAPGADRLHRHGADHRRHGPLGARPAAVERLGLGRPETWVCIAAGLALLAAFVRYELRAENPLLRLRDLQGPRLRGATTSSSSC